MQILSKTSSWLRTHLSTPGDDFKQGGDSGRDPKKTAAISAGVGAGVGAAVGGGVAYHSLSNDSVYFDYESDMMPLAASGPVPEEVFGDDISRFQSMVMAQTDSSQSSKETLQYLSYLKLQSPKVPEAELSGIYQSLESQLGNDNQVREAINMIAAHIDRHGTTPSEAYGEFSNYFGYEDDFTESTKMFLEDQKLTDQELNATTVQMVQKHTSPIGHLGMAKGVALGLVGGAAVGAASGLVVGLGINLVQKIINSDK